MGVRSQEYDLSGENYKSGPRKTILTIKKAEPFESEFETDAIRVEFVEDEYDFIYSEIYSVKKHPDAKINGLLRAVFGKTNVTFNLKDLINKEVEAYVYNKESGYKGVKFEKNAEEY